MTDSADPIDPEAQAWPIYFGLVEVLAEVCGPEIYKVEATQLPAWVRERLRAEVKPMTDPVRPVAPREELIAIARKMTGDMHTYGVDESRVDYTMPHGKFWLIKHLADALAAAPVPCAASPADPWQPIETAPRDGQRIMLLLPTGWPTFGVWYPYYKGRFLVESNHGVDSEPTHWQQLPTPPRATGEGARDAATGLPAVPVPPVAPVEELAAVADSVPLSAIRALVQQLMADADDARNRGYLEAWNTYQVCANHVAALCPAPPEET